MLFAPVLAALVLWDRPTPALIASAVFVVAAATDGLDGYLARRYASTTAMGQWLDPLADKLLVAAPVVTLTVLGRFPLWAAAIIVARELAVSVLRAWLGTRGRSMPASGWGKAKTAAQMAVILLYLLPLGPWANPVRMWTLVVAVALTVWSGLDYAFKASRSVGTTGPPGGGGPREPRVRAEGA
jgi:CDP-diacylglycerol--glycerol-3-phosphate 3-phosphatidyltransferase